MLETPSRVWRRIQDIEGQEMPSLPSIPVMEDSADNRSESTDLDLSQESDPMHSTPAAFSSHQNTVSTIKQPLMLSAGSTQRFAQSIASRSSKSGGMSASGSRGSVLKQTPSRQLKLHQSSFDISMIPSISQPHDEMEVRSSDQDTHSRDSSVDDIYLPPADTATGMEEDFDLTDALQSISRAGSPVEPVAPTLRKGYDYSMSLRSEPKVSSWLRRVIHI
jgi:hypothetical protein